MQILSIVFKYNLNTLILSHILRSCAYVLTTEIELLGS